jgi:hypothetical protein
MRTKGRIGSSFDDFLKEDGIYAEVTPRAIKRVIARQSEAKHDNPRKSPRPARGERSPRSSRGG